MWADDIDAVANDAFDVAVADVDYDRMAGGDGDGVAVVFVDAVEDAVNGQMYG